MIEGCDLLGMRRQAKQEKTDFILTLNKMCELLNLILIIIMFVFFYEWVNILPLQFSHIFIFFIFLYKNKK